METKELLRKVRKIEIRTKALSQQVFAGQYHSAFKGRGMSFSEVRPYNYGDDVRFIDWNVTARFNTPYIKVFEEERELTVMLAIDVSGSNTFGSQNTLKSDLITEVAAVLSFSAITNNDKVGVLLFSDRIEKFIPPKKGSSHILRIIRELLSFVPQNHGTDIAQALQFLTNALKKRCTTFLISDFLGADFSNPLKIASRKHDIVALHVRDVREEHLPPVGLIQVKDCETAKTITINTDSARVRQAYEIAWHNHANRLRETFRSAGVDTVSLPTDTDYIPALLNLFKQRS